VSRRCIELDRHAIDDHLPNVRGAQRLLEKAPLGIKYLPCIVVNAAELLDYFVLHLVAQVQRQPATWLSGDYHDRTFTG
jgi:hypothetical protein